MPQPEEFRISILGPPVHISPLGLSTEPGDMVADYTMESEQVLFDLGGMDRERAFERAGPRMMNFFSPEQVVAGMVTCGGLCPGMNTVIRSLVRQLWNSYGVRRILGFRYGFRGLAADTPDPPMALDPRVVQAIHLQGGTVLGSSRGPQDPSEMVDTLARLGVNLFFCIGGDGSMKGARAIQQEIRRRGMQIAVVGVPKTIDNDLPFVERTFGFETAVGIASQAIRAAHVEATGAPNGMAVVKIMGRHSGFIAASAVRASGEADLVLIPELPFSLQGEGGVKAYLRRRLAEQGQAVVVVAEGAGQEHLDVEGRDLSGNPKLGDIGVFLAETLKRELAGDHVALKYIDPSYMIRAAPANPADSIFCALLAEYAVHAAMAGKTDLVVGLWGGLFTHVPLGLVTRERKQLSTDGPLWRSVVASTGQPALLR